MKKLLLIILAFAAFGCSDDDSSKSTSNEKNYSGSLVGSWKVNTAYGDGYSYDTSSCDDTSSGVSHYTFVFKEKDFIMNYTCSPDATGVEAGPYTFNDGILVITHVDLTVRYHVYDEGSNTLKLEVISSSTGEDLGNFIIQKQ